MSDFPGAPSRRPADSHLRLRLAALTAVIIGVLLLAAAAFVVSYSGIHQIAVETGVTSMLARLYPLMFDATLVIACAAALALRGAGWGMRLYVWLSLLLLLGVAAAADAVQAMAIALPRQPSRAVVAVIPWALLLLAFGLWLTMLRQLRRMRTAGGPVNRATRQREPDADGSVAGTGTAGSGPTLTWAGGTGSSRVGIDALIEPRSGQPPAVAPATHAGHTVHPPGEPPPSAVSAGSREEPPAGPGTGEAGTSPGKPPEGASAETGRAHDEREGQEQDAGGQTRDARDREQQDREEQDREQQDRGETAGDAQAHDEVPDGAPAQAEQAGAEQAGAEQAGAEQAGAEQAGDSHPGAADPHATAAEAPFDRLHSSPARPQDQD